MNQATKRTVFRSIGRPVGIAVFAIGVIGVIISAVLHFSWDQPDANIGAGLFLIAGSLLFVVGLVILLLSKLIPPR